MLLQRMRLVGSKTASLGIICPRCTFYMSRQISRTPRREFSGQNDGNRRKPHLIQEDQIPPPASDIKPGQKAAKTGADILRSLSAAELHYYWSTTPPQNQQLVYADHFFASSRPQFLFSTLNFRELPLSSTPEVAILGRSNVGKSSLVNALLNRSNAKLAHVSKKPGRTRTMNAFGVGGTGGGLRAQSRKKDGAEERWIGPGGLVLMDMPGHGYRSQPEWGKQITKYLQQRKQLRRAFLIVDPEHGMKEMDKLLLDILRQDGVPHQIILSKVDKILLTSKTKVPSAETLRSNLLKLRHIAENVREESQRFGGSLTSGEMMVCGGRYYKPVALSVMPVVHMRERYKCE